MAEAIEVMQVKRLELIDGDGVVRGVLGTRDDGSDAGFHQAYLDLASPDGEVHATLLCEGDTAALEFWEGGNSVAYLGSNRDGVAKLILSEPEMGTRHIALDNVSPIRVTLGYDSPLIRRVRKALGR